MKSWKKTYRGQHLWARGYFVAITGNVIDEIVAEDIEKQGQQDIDAGTQDFGVEE